MQVEFRAISESQPGAKWAAQFERLWPGYRNWFLKEGDEQRPGYLKCLRAMRHHMPELVPTYERLVELAGGGDMAARFLSLYQPTPYMTGCSQAVWTRGDAALVRNYDYSPRLWEGLLLHTQWNGRRVIAMSDCLWGALDGINESGLALSLAFGGSQRVGDGFGIPLILRYVLEFCDTVAEASAVLARVPSHMAYNITLLDAAGDYLTVFVSPGQEAQMLKRPFATNHQHNIEWTQYVAGVASLDRERTLVHHLNNPDEDGPHFFNRFLKPPLFFAHHATGWGTLYTSVYKPAQREACYRWPDFECRQSCEQFTEMGFTLTYPGD